MHSQILELDVLVKDLGRQLRNAVVVQHTAVACGHENHGAHAHAHTCSESATTRTSPPLMCTVGCVAPMHAPSQHCTLKRQMIVLAHAWPRVHTTPHRRLYLMGLLNK